MVSDTQVRPFQARSINVAQVRNLRNQAESLLRRLSEDQQQSERRTAASGKRDAMKTITGRTAMETAIEKAREIVLEMDRILAEAEPYGASPAVQRSASQAAPRQSASKPTLRPVKLVKMLPIATTVPAL